MQTSAGGKRELNAINLKEVLWDTLNDVRKGKITPASGDVVASQAREILRTVRTQLTVFAQAGRAVSQELVDFSMPGAGEPKKRVRRKQ